MTQDSSETKPEIIEMPVLKMAVIHDKGTPGDVFSRTIPALFSSIYAPHLDFAAGAMRARYPLPLETPQEQWIIEVGLPVRADTAEVPSGDSGIKLETWQYGTVAQILHIGSYAEEEESVGRLMAFIAESGYHISGIHEEEYLTAPGAVPQKTIIRYQVTRG